MSSLNREQVNFSLQSFMMFASAALATKTLPPSFVRAIREKSLLLCEKMSEGSLDCREAMQELKKMIEEANRTMPPGPLKLPYPMFIEKPIASQVKNNLIAFELFL